MLPNYGSAAMTGLQRAARPQRFEDMEGAAVSGMRSMGPMAGQRTDDWQKEMNSFAARDRMGKSFGNDVGSLEDLKATAKTPADLERIHMNADGQYYRPEYTAADMMRGKTGFGGGGNDARRAPIAGVGTIAAAEQQGNLAKYGTVFGPAWTDVADLNRGRESTGFGQQHDPLAGFSEAAQQGAGAAQRFSYDQAQGAAQDARNNTLQQLLAGLKKARGGG